MPKFLSLDPNPPNPVQLLRQCHLSRPIREATQALWEGEWCQPDLLGMWVCRWYGDQES